MPVKFYKLNFGQPNECKWLYYYLYSSDLFYFLYLNLTDLTLSLELTNLFNFDLIKYNLVVYSLQLIVGFFSKITSSLSA